MRTQDYSGPPRLTLGVVGLVAVLIPILLGYFLVTGFASNPCYEGLCGTTATTTSTSSTPGTVVQVSIPKGAGDGPQAAPGYAPDILNVTVGTTVVWTNNDPIHHTVTSVPGNGSLNSGDMALGAVYNYTFTSPGTYNYLCVYHAWMTGTVVVSPASTQNGGGAGPIQVSIPVGAGDGPQAAPGYAPDKITVVIGVNNTVVWTNHDPIHHTVTSVSGNGSLNSGDMAQGATYNYTFTAPGTYNYFCVYHVWMTGTVVVLAGSGGSGSTNSSSSSTSSISTSTSSSSSSNSSSKQAPPANAIPVSIPVGAGDGPQAAPGYAPDNVTLVIGVNNTVVWTNNDPIHHTVTSVKVPNGVSPFNSGDMALGATYDYTFTVPGVYTYYCVYHPWMTGTIIVEASSG